MELTLEAGGEPPFDAVARRAGLGIGTLYRHFPDRERLLEAVAHHALQRSIEAAETALITSSDGYEALRQYMHAAIGLGAGVLNVIQPLLQSVFDEPDWRTQRARMTTLLESILRKGKRAGLLRRETQLPDIVFAVIRFSRPVALGLSREDERALAHRHLDIYVDGLGAPAPAQRALPEPRVLERWTSRRR